MKSKGLIISLVVLLSIIAVSLVGLLAVMLTRTSIFSFSVEPTKSKLVRQEEYQIENLHKIKIKAISSDVEIKNSNDNKIIVKYYGEKKNEVIFNSDGSVLSLEEKAKNRFCFGFCNLSKKFVLYVPKDLEIDMDYSTISGDVTFEEEYSNANLKLKTTSGDANITNVSNLTFNTISGDLKMDYSDYSTITTTSGDVTIDEVGGYLKLGTTSGDVRINKFEMKKNSSINTISGDVSISNIGDIYVDTKTTSGDVRVKNSNRKSDYILNVKTVSGDILVQ